MPPWPDWQELAQQSGEDAYYSLRLANAYASQGEYETAYPYYQRCTGLQANFYLGSYSWDWRCTETIATMMRSGSSAAARSTGPRLSRALRYGALPGPERAL